MCVYLQRQDRTPFFTDGAYPGLQVHEASNGPSLQSEFSGQDFVEP